MSGIPNGNDEYSSPSTEWIDRESTETSRSRRVSMIREGFYFMLCLFQVCRFETVV